MLVDISIIIVTWNSKETVKKCLDSVINSHNVCIVPHEFSFYQNKGLNLRKQDDVEVYVEIVVIDSGSTDNLVELVEEYPKVGFKFLDINRGFSFCSNLGFKFSKGNLLFFLNPDIQLTPNSIHLLFKEIYSLQKIGVLSPVLLNDDLSPAELPVRFPTIISVLSDLPVLNVFVPDVLRKAYSITRNVNEPIETDWVLGAAMLIPREVFYLTGGFDENYFLFSEDIDLCYRIKKCGFNILYSPITKITHTGGSTTQKVNYLRDTVLWESAFIYFRKHKGRLYGLITRVFVLIAYFLELIKYSFLFIWSGFSSMPIKNRIIICEMAIKTSLNIK